MSVELNTIAPKKWVQDFSGTAPTLDITDGVRIGDFAIDSSNNAIWRCHNNADTVPVWVLVGDTNITLISNTYSASITDGLILANASGGSFTITLPAASGEEGVELKIKKIDDSANAVTVDGNGSETIDGEVEQYVSAQYDCMEIICDGTSWHII